MGYHVNSERSGHRSDRFWYQVFENKNSPRYKRTRPTKRQRVLAKRRYDACLCPQYFQIGGGQCLACGRFTRLAKYGRTKDV